MRSAVRALTQKGSYAGWRARKPITVNHAQAAGTVAPFIASFDLTADADIASFASLDLSDVRFTDANLNPLPYEVECLGGAELSADASWCWFNDPRVVCYKGTHNRVFAAGTAGKTGSVLVTQFDVDTNAIVVGSLHSTFEVDDHSCPGIIVLPGGKIMAFYAQHNTTTGLVFYRTTTSVEDVSAWNTEQSFQASPNTQNACYPNPHLLSAEGTGIGRMYVLFRDNHSQLSYVTSDNYTAATPTWSATQPLITNGTTAFIYNKQISNGVDRIDIGFTDDAPDLSGTGGGTVGTNNLYHVYIQGGNVHSADGTVISSLAALGTGLTPAQLSAALIATNAQGGPYWMWDIVTDGSGNPCFVYVSFPNSDWTGILYHYARWTGTAWQLSTITVAGSTMAPNLNAVGGSKLPSYAGGIGILPDDVSMVYLSRQVSKQGCPDAFEIEKWHTPDQGLTWAKAKTVTPGARRKNTRPVCPRNRALLTTTPPEVLFMSGAYTSYQNISQSMLAYPPPTGMTVKRAARVQVPSVDNATDKTVLMYYGNPNGSDAQGTTFETVTQAAQPFMSRWTVSNTFEHATALTVTGWTAFTLSGWANLPVSGSDGIADFLFANVNIGTRTSGIRLWVTSGVPSSDLNVTAAVVGGAFSDKTGLHDGANHHYCVTYDSTTLKLYVDGVVASTTFSPASPPKALVGPGAPTAADLGWSPASALASSQRRVSGTLSDWRLDNVLRSTTWIQTQAKAQAGLLTVGSNVNRQW